MAARCARKDRKVVPGRYRKVFWYLLEKCFIYITYI